MAVVKADARLQGRYFASVFDRGKNRRRQVRCRKLRAIKIVWRGFCEGWR